MKNTNYNKNNNFERSVLLPVAITFLSTALAENWLAYIRFLLLVGASRCIYTGFTFFSQAHLSRTTSLSQSGNVH